jgi:formate dehydrogenase major subunit
VWLGIDVGSDIALANPMARAIIRNNLIGGDFIARATIGYDEFCAVRRGLHSRPRRAETGAPAAAIEEVALAYAQAQTEMIRWTLGISEHHNATDNLLALINLGLLTAKVGRYSLVGGGQLVMRAASQVGYPCVIKAVSLSGSRGVLQNV